MSALARANIGLRTGERVLIVLADFEAKTFEQLFQGVYRLPLEDYIPKNGAFPVKGHSIKSQLFSIPDCQAIIKKAIVRSMSEVYGISYFPEEGVKYQVEFFILNDEATLMIDTSGEPLHKRGYRREANAAPIRETLAAAIVATSRPREDVLMWDPMCGSGTLAIEAAMQMRNIAPGMRRNFAAEKFPYIPHVLWRNAKEEALEGITDSKFEVFASDIDEECVKLTKDNAYRAGVLNSIKVFKQDARRISAPGRRGTIVTNPPYGERIGTIEEVERLYRDIGVHFRSLAPWQVYVITSHDGFERLYGRRADKVKKLYNGMLPCYLYQFFKNNK
jgi:putative N6-adenine-specific DNA methylase